MNSNAYDKLVETLSENLRTKDKSKVPAKEFADAIKDFCCAESLPSVKELERVIEASVIKISGGSATKIAEEIYKLCNGGNNPPIDELKKAIFDLLTLTDACNDANGRAEKIASAIKDFCRDYCSEQKKDCSDPVKGCTTS